MKAPPLYRSPASGEVLSSLWNGTPSRGTHVRSPRGYGSSTFCRSLRNRPRCSGFPRFSHYGAPLRPLRHPYCIASSINRYLLSAMYGRYRDGQYG